MLGKAPCCCHEARPEVAGGSRARIHGAGRPAGGPGKEGLSLLEFLFGHSTRHQWDKEKTKQGKVSRLKSEVIFNFKLSCANSGLTDPSRYDEDSAGSSVADSDSLIQSNPIQIENHCPCQGRAWRATPEEWSI